MKASCSRLETSSTRSCSKGLLNLDWQWSRSYVYISLEELTPRSMRHLTSGKWTSEKVSGSSSDSSILSITADKMSSCRMSA